ncbi:hypothetical protein [Phormidesmis sp. 146-33]
MTKESALLVLALVSLIGCQQDSRGVDKSSSPLSSSTLDSRDASAPSAIDAESVRVLVGHWRKTTIVFENPQDEHLVLNTDGAATTWEVTASGRSPTTIGTWTVESKMLTLRLAGNTIISHPFTIYQEQLVFPNIKDERGFWEKIAQ